jgi:dienelactone hydrolase
MMKRAVLLLFFSCYLGSAAGALTEKTLTYTHGETDLAGFLVVDSTQTGKRPGVLVVHEWWGLNDYARERSRALAKQGYVVFAVDMYGAGKTTRDPAEAGDWSGHLKGSPLLRERAMAGLAILQAQPLVDPELIAAIGFCFGGTTVLELAMNGAPLKGVVSLHGGLPQEAPKVKVTEIPRILICHGADDGFVPPDQIQTFQGILDQLNADWQMIFYSGVKHSFTNPDADSFNIPGVAYSAKAASRSNDHMLLFFKELFKR